MNIFISQPISGINKHEYWTTRVRLEGYCRARYMEPKFVNYFISSEPDGNVYKHPDLWYVSKSIDQLAKADVFVILKGADLFSKGCKIEKQCAELYGIPIDKASIV